MLHEFLVCVFFFFKQKTAYEMRISDWSSDVCSSDLGSSAHAAKILAELAAKAIEELGERGKGGRHFRATFFRSDGLARTIAIETGHPTRDTGLVMRLFAERMDSLADPLDPGFGFDMIRLAVPRLEALGASQLKLEGGAVKDAAIDELADRPATRLGRGRVRRLRGSEERGGGTECGSTCGSRGSPCH